MPVTGGAGFIGSHLVDALYACRRTGTDGPGQPGQRRPRRLPDGVKLVEMDIADDGVVEAIAELKPEVVIHAAAQVSVAVSMQDPHLDLAVSVQGTANVFEGAKAAGARRFVFASSDGGLWRIRWRRRRRPAASEELLRRAQVPRGALRGAERALLRERAAGQRLRPQAALGPRRRGGRHLHREAPERKAILINGTGEQRRDLVYVTDVVDSLLTMARSDRDGTWNVATGVSSSILELLHVLEKKIEPPTEVCHGPPRPGDVDNSSLAIDSVENALGWRPEYDLAGGIADMIRKANKDR